MDMINAYTSMNLASIQQSISVAMLQKTMNQDALSVGNLIQQMEQVSNVSSDIPNFDGSISMHV